MFRLFLLCLLGVTLSLTQDLHYHCYSPPELTYRASLYNHALTTFSMFRGQWDARNSRVAYHEERYDVPQQGKQYLRFIFDYKHSVAYEFNEKTKACKKFVPGKFYPLGVPHNARMEAEYFIGGPGETIDAIEWSDRITFKPEDWIGVFSRHKCYPIRWILMNLVERTSITTNMYNIVEGLADPYMFIPPPECLKLKESVPMSEKAKQLQSFSSRSTRN